ncbi:leucine carboxyl methyltransferase [Panus rudis PR-1116 ss-1]|nr:leucine carboxyl methyltransferase [Panus rudis PR-1116 ss-1]
MNAPPMSFGGRMQNVQPDGDAAIRQTDSDAALARFSAVQKGYFTDPFIKPLLPRGSQYQPPRPPLINVGTYVRSEAIDALVSQWITLAGQEGKKCQIVSLGAGSDTRFWRIANSPQKDLLASYVELDFSENTTKKAMAIRKSRELSALLGTPDDVKLANGGTALHAPVYHLVPADMRKSPDEVFPTSFGIDGGDRSHIISPNLPTLLLFECVLVYMKPSESDAVIKWFTDYFSTSSESTVLGGIVYEMFGLNDSFGKVMLNNLKARNVDLPGAEPYPTFASLPQRFLRHGFDVARALTLREIRRAYIDPVELERISHLELLDEIEELELVLDHYAITWGVKLYEKGSSLGASWKGWGLHPKIYDDDSGSDVSIRASDMLRR